jgi:hypothetical protein
MDLCAIFHANNCDICNNWRNHYDDDSQSFIRARISFRAARDQALEDKRFSLAQEEEAGYQELDALCCELGQIREETKRAQQDQQRIDKQVAGKICQIIDQLQIEIEDACRVSPPEPPSPQPRKRMHRTCTPSQHRPMIPSQAGVQEIIFIDCEPNRDHVPTGPIPAPAPDSKATPTPEISEAQKAAELVVLTDKNAALHPQHTPLSTPPPKSMPPELNSEQEQSEDPPTATFNSTDDTSAPCKIGIQHLQLVYGTVGDTLQCRMCLYDASIPSAIPLVINDVYSGSGRVK